MKKLKYLLVAAVLPLMMTSCWEAPDQTSSDPMNAGLWIYNTAVIQSTYALDPAAVAFRLNCLLTDKQLQGANALNEVITEAEALEMKFLFGESTFIEENYKGVEGDYRILFDINSDKGQSDRARGGAVIISTGGKLLTELTDNDMWVIEPDYDNLLNYKATEAEQLTCEGFADYIITASPADGGFTQYNVAIKDYVSKSQLGVYKSSWTGVYGIIPQTTSPLSMSVARKAIYSMSIAMQGPTFAALDGVNHTNIRYLTTENNIYKPACSLSNGVVYRASGEEYVAMTGNYDAEVFPSAFVMVKFTPAAGDCGKVMATMTYNGESRELQAN